MDKCYRNKNKVFLHKLLYLARLAILIYALLLPVCCTLALKHICSISSISMQNKSLIVVSHYTCVPSKPIPLRLSSAVCEQNFVTIRPLRQEENIL